MVDEMKSHSPQESPENTDAETLADDTAATDTQDQKASEKPTDPADAAKAHDTASAPEAQSASDDAPQEQAPIDPADQMAELNDKLLRALAELENTRRRAERDRIDAQQYGMMRFGRDMLSVADNLGRALAALPEESRADLPENVAALIEGVAATERDLLATFERHQISPITPLGEKFDPNFHEAMFEAPGTGQAAGTIIEVIEAGYRIGDRLLRPARVGVAKAD